MITIICDECSTGANCGDFEKLKNFFKNGKKIREKEKGYIYYFCSEQCSKKFKSNVNIPNNYIIATKE